MLLGNELFVSLEKELNMCEESYQNLQKGIGGRRRMGQVMHAVRSVDEGGSGGGFSDDLLKVGLYLF